MHHDHERTLFQKVILCILAAMTVLFAILTALSRSHEGIVFEKKLLDITQEESQTVYTGKIHGERVTVITYAEDGGDMVDFTVGDRYHALCRVEYPEGTISTDFGTDVHRIRVLRDGKELFRGGYDPDTKDAYRKYYNEDGTWEPFVSIKAHYGNDPWYYYELSVGDILYFVNGPKVSVQGSWSLYMMALLMAALAAVEVAFPKTLFHLNHRWYVQNPEPTDFYYFMHGLASVVMAGAALVFYIMALCAIE